MSCRSIIANGRICDSISICSLSYISLPYLLYNLLSKLHLSELRVLGRGFWVPSPWS